MVTFDDEEEAVRIANDTEFGLVGYAFTRDLARGQRLIESLQTGMLGLNVGVVSNAAAPFGGVKQSGHRARRRLRGDRGVLVDQVHADSEPVLLTARIPSRQQAQ